MLEVQSYNFPNSVFIGEDGLIEVPSLSLYHATIKKMDFLFLVGDIQPLDEVSSHSFCDAVIDVFEECGGKEIITLGGIGLPEVPQNPKVYVTANEKKVKEKYSVKGVNKDIYGVVGPIIGVSGLLLGAAKKRGFPAVSLLAQTYGHPNYIGVKGARALLRVLSSVLTIDINMEELDQEIKEMELNLKKIQPLKKGSGDKPDSKLSYIG